jgi:2-methylcitrate dehydratase PrpD
MSQSNKSLRQKLADFIQGTSFSNIPAEAIQRAKKCTLDLIGVSIAGGRQKTSEIISRLIIAGGGSEEATPWGSDQKIPVQSAVLLNAVQGHAIDMDDGHRFANGHPGVMTIPTAIALAERENLTGWELIEALVAGYDIFIRLGTAINPDLLMRGFHTTATTGTFASAAVASKLLRLSVPQTETALSLAGLQSAGLLEALSSGEMGKSFQVGKAAQSGVLAALLAQRGADGPDLIFEGDKGFFKAFAGKPCDMDIICRDLGTRFEITNVYFKRHAACRHIHSALDATAEIVAKHNLTAADIALIEIETYSIAKNLTGHLATQGSELAAKFSTPIAVALLLVFGQSDSAAFKNQYISDPQVQALAKKVTVKVNPDRDKTYPQERGALVTVNTQTDVYKREVLYPKGEIENPLTDQEFISKYEKNARLRYTKDRVDDIRDIVLNLENAEIGELTALLKAPASG